MIMATVEELTIKLIELDKAIGARGEYYMIQAEDSTSKNKQWLFLGKYEAVVDVRAKMRASLADYMSFSDW